MVMLLLIATIMGVLCLFHVLLYSAFVLSSFAIIVRERERERETERETDRERQTERETER